jgi:cystathionine gamma-synthase
MNSDRKHGTATLLAQANHLIDQMTGAIIPPVYVSTTYARDSNYELVAHGLSYSRENTPNCKQLETLLAVLEGGADALTFGSGMAAVSALFETLKPGDHVVAPAVMYHAVRTWLNDFCPRWGLAHNYFDASKQGSLERVIRSGRTKIVWIETPANPTCDITDIAEAAELAHNAGARLVVDSTLATPMLTRPIEHGADIVLHSATKYLNGHSDVLAGALICREDDNFWQSIRFQRVYGGAALGSFEAWLLLRGMRTLHLRMQQACDNAMRIAQHFETHKKIERVLYPGLQSHPRHTLAQRQMKSGFGGMLSLLVRGDAQAARTVASRTRVFVPATSFGGVESLIEHRATVEGPSSRMPPNLLRLSIGIELVEDLIIDLEHALEAI